MADMNGSSRAFTPPVNTVKDTDPQVVKVPMAQTDWGFRKSQNPPMNSPELSVRNLSNGQ